MQNSSLVCPQQNRFSHALRQAMRTRIPFGRQEFAVEVDAPRLRYINIRGDQSYRFVAKNLSSLFMVDIDTNFYVVPGTSLLIKKGIILNFLSGISNVRHMIISQPTLQALSPYLEQGPIFKFRNLSRLEASFCTVLLQVLPNFLYSFPNLKHLTLYLVYLEDLQPHDLELIIVPWCLLFNLEFFEIKEVITVKKVGTKRGRNGQRNVLKHKKMIWIETVRYILENSLVLKKLILCFSPITNKALDISNELLTFKKRSERCEIFIRLTSR
ncbi:unnamed protein product [Thlaspi arvense]|uniref:FBD domain-containing protein n=1 Tax=Thlaspi arvense TaxID=13288 RepID=A0AAU9SGL1_THLAR|nr:unnamed protein product [Thlaspi arvense]